MGAAHEGKDSKVMYIVCQEVGLGLIGKMQSYVDDMILHTENPSDSTQKCVLSTYCCCC